jgi:endonuclease/exonuclease/phosphatase family metal-dependent hydrolase
VNIRYSNDHDGKHAWINRKPLLQKFLNENQLDFFGTQEGRETQIKELAEKLNFKIIESHRNWISERMYPTLFYSTSKYVAIESDDFWLSLTPQIAGSSSFNSSFPRLATWARLRCISTNEIYMVINTHLDHVCSKTRIEQSKVLVSEIQKCIQINDKIILLGDFNDSPKSDVYNYICEKLMLIDHWVLKKIPEVTSHHSFNGPGTAGSRIDWILCSNNFDCINIYLEQNSSNGIYLSDHFPLVATLIPNCK